MSVRESAHTHSRGSSAGGVALAAAPAAAPAAASPPPPPPPRPAPATLASERGISVSTSGTMRGLTSARRLSSAIGEWQTLERKEGREAQGEQHTREPEVDGRAHHRRPVHLVRVGDRARAWARAWARVRVKPPSPGPPGRCRLRRHPVRRLAPSAAARRHGHSEYGHSKHRHSGDPHPRADRLQVGWPRVDGRVREDRAGDHRLRKACQRDAGDSDREERRPRP
eukprot:scaffold19417_cov56-Phaeocystis_antarctica.AAC.4